MRRFNNILITGGAGFIGTNLIYYLFGQAEFLGKIINVDKLTYSGNLNSLNEIEETFGGSRYFFEQADICDQKSLNRIMQQYKVDCIIHFAAESHVDRSIYGPSAFVQTNIVGTFNLLEAARRLWLTDAGHSSQVSNCSYLFHHISTDEVFGSLGETGFFFENTPYDPRSPYSASKASSDHLVKAYFHTYGLPVTISNCSNNYGPYQFPEKLIPLMLLNMLEGKPLPMYGDGMNIRDWLYVKDHCSGIWKIVLSGRLGETYNIGGENEWTNVDLINSLCGIAASKMGKEKKDYAKLITFVQDRLGHDRRYAINCDKIKNELDWKQSVTFEEGLMKTVNWYLSNADWVEQVKSRDYKKWLDQNYAAR